MDSLKTDERMEQAPAPAYDGQAPAQPAATGGTAPAPAYGGPEQPPAQGGLSQAAGGGQSSQREDGGAITRISQVTPEVTLFLRRLGFSDYYIIKIFALVGDAAAALTEDDPYWLLEEFPSMRFETADNAAAVLGFEKDNYYRVRAGINHVMSAFASRGHSFAAADELCRETGEFLDLPSQLVRDTAEDMAMSGELRLTVSGGREVFYFYGYYRAECSVVSRITSLMSGDLKPVAGDVEALIRKTEEARGIKLSEKQKDAVGSTLKSGAAIITGGPGTGKTTIINTLIEIAEESGLKVAVAAPTGRGAKRVTEVTGREATTVHRLLECWYDERTGRLVFGRNEEEPLDQDMVIVDEASMIDLMLAGNLCRALKSGSRLILTGDVDQLPSVGAGNVLRDLIDSECVPVAALDEVFRQAKESSIVVNAHRINKGEYPDFGGDLQLIPAQKQDEVLKKITELVKTLPPEEVQIITPVKKGLLGSRNLNDMLQQTFNPGAEGKAELKFGSRTFRTGDRVMQLKNNYRLEYRKKDGSWGKGIFNGETGMIEAVHPEDKKLTVCYDGERWVEYPYVQLDEVELAYAITVHKSQGSEFPTVIIPMSWFPPALATRNLIYTAITRGREKVVIVGRGDYLNAMIDNDNEGTRNSGLRERLASVYMEVSR